MDSKYECFYYCCKTMTHFVLFLFYTWHAANGLTTQINTDFNAFLMVIPDIVTNFQNVYNFRPIVCSHMPPSARAIKIVILGKSSKQTYAIKVGMHGSLEMVKFTLASNKVWNYYVIKHFLLTIQSVGIDFTWLWSPKYTEWCIVVDKIVHSSVGCY